MATITFDTHEFFTALKNAGFSDQQAEVIIKLQKTAVSSALEQTRLEYDLDSLVTNQTLDGRLKELELKLSIKIAENNTLIEKTKSDLSRLYVSLVLLQTTLITGILLKVAHLI